MLLLLVCLLITAINTLLNDTPHLFERFSEVVVSYLNSEAIISAQTALSHIKQNCLFHHQQ